MKNKIKFAIAVIGFLVFFLGLFWISIGGEIYFYKTSKYAKYTFEIINEYGNKDTIVINEPAKDIHFQINHHYSYGKYDYYSFESVWDSEYWLVGGHWRSIRKGVVSYKLISKTPL